MIPDNVYNELESELATVNPKTGRVPEERLKDADSLRAIDHNLNEADQNGSFNRSNIQKLRDGHPPFSQEERAEEGTDDQFNVNTGTARLILDEATSGVMDIFNANRLLMEIPLKSPLPDPLRKEYQSKLEFAVTRMLRRWDAFTTRVTNLCNTFTCDGIGILFHEDPDSWQFNCCGLAEMKFPRGVEPLSSRIPIATMTKRVQVGTLWRKIKDEDVAKGKGWNPEAVKAAILEASNAGKQESEKWRNWELLQRELKGNEIYISTVSNPVEIIYGFVEEFDGSISVYMATKASGDKRVTEFLYKKRGAYDSANRLYQVFPYSTGSGQDLYTIRGMGHFIYQPALAENIMWSRFMDAAMQDAMTYFESRSGEEIEDAILEDFGPNALLAPGIQLAENQKSRGIHQNLVPAMKEIRETLNRISGGMNEGPMMFGERANQENISAVLDQLNKMNAFAITLFYPPLDRAYSETLRRIFVENKDTPESLAMKEELRREGVPVDSLKDMIDFHGIKAVRLLGNGSKASRLGTLRQIGMKYASMDAQGRKEYDWDLVAELGDESRANRYIGPVNKTRMPHDAKIAVLENAEMLEGEDIEPFDGEDHFTHLQFHLRELLETKDSVEDNPDGLADYVMRYIKIWDHANATLSMLTVQPDTPFEDEANEMRAQIQRLGEFFHNGMKRIAAEAAASPPEKNPEESVDTELVAFQNAERRKDLETQAEIQRKNAKTQAEVAALDAKTAAAIRNSKS